MKTPLEILRALVIDIESLQCKGDLCWFGDFAHYDTTENGTVKVEWPNLAILLTDAKAALDQIGSLESVKSGNETDEDGRVLRCRSCGQPDVAGLCDKCEEAL